VASGNPVQTDNSTIKEQADFQQSWHIQRSNTEQTEKMAAKEKPKNPSIKFYRDLKSPQDIGLH
jgi:hypothetical protein